MWNLNCITIKHHNKPCRPLRALLFLQCPAPAWPDFGPGRPPAPASHLSTALGAARIPTTCSVAEHTRAAPRRSVGARTLTSPWRVFLTVTWTRSSLSPPKWHARVHSVPYHMHLTSNHTSLYLPSHAQSVNLSCPFICTTSSWKVTGHTSTWRLSLLVPSSI